jgi:SAM-dependent methyltransferase
VAGDKDFYDLAHEGSSYPAWRWEFDVAFDLISKSAKQQPRILEIGAGDGAFIYKLLNAITPAENLVAIEYSEHGKAKIQSSGISCFAKDIRTISDDELGGKFDYICLFQVLEHLDHLDDLLQSFASHLNSEGQVIIAVPNNKRIEFNELNGALLDMPPNHIGRWTRKAFDQFAKNNNFVVLHHKYEPANFIAEAIQFVKYRLLKRSHNVNSLSNRVLFEKNRLIRGVGIRLIILIDTLLNFNKLVNLALKIRKRGGGCQLVILGRSNLS